MSLFLFQHGASGATTAGRWFTAPEISAALVTAIFTVGGVVLKDYIFKLLEERRSQARAQSAIYDRYSHPLVNSAISLLYRLHEILCEQHRPVYLLGKGLSNASNPGGIYRHYKKLSIVYRLAAMLGWIRACRREFSYLRVAEVGKAEEVHNAIDTFEKALSDGSWVEWERLTRLCELWRLCKPSGLEKTKTNEDLATQVDNLIWNHLEREQIDDVSQLTPTAQRALCRSAADHICSHLRTNTVAEESMERLWPEAFAILGMQEAWIYRDWQSAIGDMMIRSTDSDDRRFEVIGYGEFEELAQKTTDPHYVSIERLLRLFDDLDLSIEDRFDARSTQLRSVATATAKLVLAIDTIQADKSIVSKSSKEIANKVIHDLHMGPASTVR